MGVSVGAHAGGEENPGDADLFLDVGREIDLAAQRGGAFAPPAGAKRGVGRPRGSGDRKTLKMWEVLRARGYRDPMEQLAALASSDPNDLGDALCEGVAGLKPEHRVGARVKAAAIIAKAAADLMPYAYRRLPQEVEVTETRETRTLFVIADATQQNQTLSATALDVSDGGLSDDPD